MLNDKRLIWQFNKGTPEALHEIYEKYKGDLLTLATALLSDSAAAEDVVHDVFISFLRSSGKFRLTGSLKRYLLTCVANAARNVMRTRRRHASVELGQAGPLQTTGEAPELRSSSLPLHGIL